MNAIEFHTWNSTTRDFAHPDRMVFDLDPGEGVDFPRVREGTALLRAFLDELGLAAWLKTSGGKGLHVVVPHAPGPGWEAAKAFSRAIVEHVAGVLPRQFVAHRVGRVYIDSLRNGFGATTACAWSVRARRARRVGAGRLERSRRADRRRALGRRQRRRAPGGCRQRAVAGVCEEAADAGARDEEARLRSRRGRLIRLSRSLRSRQAKPQPCCRCLVGDIFLLYSLYSR